MKMIVKGLKDSKTVICPNMGFISHRYLTEKDNMGFTITKTIIPVNGEHLWHYKKHLEACFCVAGWGKVTNIKTGKVFNISKDIMYALDKNDPHKFEALEEVTLICVFNPPLKGNEIHKKDGSY